MNVTYRIFLSPTGNRIPELGVERRGPDSIRNIKNTPPNNVILLLILAGFNMAVVQRESGGFPVQWEDRGL